MPKLNIPYRSQWDGDARDHDSDCGPTCLAMMLNYHGVNITPDNVYDYDHLRAKGRKDFTNFTDLAKVARANDMVCAYAVPSNRNEAFRKLRANVDADMPMLALVNYNNAWINATGNNYAGGHFVVIAGYDDTNIYIHDPLFGMWVKPSSRGSYFTMSHDLFAAGWGGFSPADNPNWACMTIKRKGGVPAPKPKPVVVRTETAVSPTTNISTDIQRRIRTLATYRRAEMPDFNNANDVKLWQDHLGDFALTYDYYVVQSGDSFSAVASRFYDGQHRWPIIKEYNNMQRDGLWLGETLRIPHMGKSGAQHDTALPINTIDQTKALAFDDLVDPDVAAQDYNDFGSNSIGIGVYEES